MDWSCFENKESEKNWERRDAVMQALQKKPIEIDRVQLDYVCSAINSLRTQLQFNALLAVESLIQSNNMDPYAEILLAGLFKVISGSKKVVSQPSINAASLLIQNTQPTSRILAILSKMSKEKGVVVRNSTVLLLTIFYQNTLDSNWLVKSHSMDVFAKIIVRLLHDADSSVREHARTLFLLFESNDFQNSQKVLSNVQDHILKSISRDRSKITQSRLTAPPIPIEMSPKKAKSVIVLNRSTSRDSSDSDISAKSSPSSYHSRPRTAKLLDSNTFFDDVLGNINKSFDEVTGIESNNIVPVLPNESESEFNHSNPDIIVDDGDVEPEINQILNSTSDRFTVENFNTLQGLSKQHPVFNNQQDKNQVWNIATCQAVLDKIIHIVGESPEDEPKEDCFILLQHIITNQGLLIQGQESAVLSCTLKYHEFDKDHLKAAGFYCYIACVSTLRPDRLFNPLYDLLQSGLVDDSISSEFIVDLLEGMEILLKRYELDPLKKYKKPLLQLLLSVIDNVDPTVRLLGYRNFVNLFTRFGTKLIEDIQNRIEPRQVRILQVYLQNASF